MLQVNATAAIAIISNTTLFIPIVSHPIILLWFLVVTVISILGAFAGFLLMSALFHQHNFREGANPLIIHLLAVDSFNLFLPTVLANAAIYAAQDKRVFDVDCTPLFFIQYTLIAVSHWNSVFLAINRLVAISLPHYYRSFSHSYVLTATLLFTWAISLVSTVPHLFGYAANYKRIPPIGYCGTAPNNLAVYAILNGMTNTPPFCIQGFAYAVVIVGILRSNRVTTAKTKNDKGRQRRQQTIAVMLIVWFLWYLLCYLPTPLITTYFLGFLKSNWPLFLWMKLLLTCGPAGTPFIFLVLNAEYRTAVRTLLGYHRGAVGAETVATYRQQSMRSSTNAKSRSGSVTLTRGAARHPALSTIT